jgi:tetratricopeptide (TPR) repeat protein
MHKKINYKFVLGLIAVMAIVAVPIHYLHGYQVRRSVHSLLDQANRAEERGQIVEAAGFLGRYLNFAPFDNETLLRYGILLADSRLAGSPPAKQRALNVVSKVLYREPDRTDARRLSVRLAMELGLYSEALADIQEHLLIAHPKDGELHRMLGRCLEKTAQFSKARDAYESAIALVPAHRDAYLSLAALLRQRTADVAKSNESPAELHSLADAKIDALVTANPQSHQSYLIRAGYKRTYHAPRRDAAVQKAIDADLAQAQKVAGDSPDVLLAIADWQRERGSLAEAIATLRRGCELHPNDWALIRGAARLQRQSGNSSGALECLQLGLKHLPNQIDLLWDLADLLIESDRGDEAAPVLVRMRSAGIPDAMQEYLAARLDMQRKNWKEAVTLLERAYPVLVDLGQQTDAGFAHDLAQQAILALGQSYERMGDLDRAHRTFTRVIARYPDFIPGRLGLAWCLAAMGRLPDALDQYQQLLRLPRAPIAGWLEVARLKLLRNLERPEAERNWDEVSRALSVASEIQPPPPLVALLRAELFAAQRQFDAAKKLLVDLHPDPKSRPAVIWAGLATLEDRKCQDAATQLERKGDSSSADKLRNQGRSSVLAFLDEAVQFAGDHVDLRLARARTCANLPSAEIRSQLLKWSDDVDRFNIDDRVRLWRGLASASLQADDAPGAIRLWERIANQLPGDVASRLVLFDLAAQAGNADSMLKWQRQLHDIESNDGVLWRYARARFLVEEARRGKKEGLEEARSQIGSVAAKRPDWPRVALCEALIEDLSGRYDAALRSYLRALRQGAVDPLAALRTAQLLYINQRYDEANQWFRRVPDQLLFPQEVQQAAADAALRSQDAARALNLAQSAVADDTADFRHIIWLAWMNWKAGELQRAKSAFEKARDRAPHEPDAWVALIEFLGATGQLELARAEVETAQQRLQSPAARPALARCLEIIGRTQRAAELYEQAIAESPDDLNTVRNFAAFCLRTGRLPEAQTHLRKLLTLSRAQSPETFAMARRTLAFLLTFQGDPETAREALTLLAPDPDDRGSAANSVEDRRAHAQLLAMQNKRAAHRRAIQTLESLIEENTASPDDYFLVAQLYEVIGDWPKSRQRFLAVIEMPGGDNPVVLATAARTLLRRKDTTSVRDVLRKLEAGDPDGLLTLEIRARLLRAEGQTAEACALLKELGSRPQADLLHVAALLVEFEDHPAAESLLRRHASAGDKAQSALPLIRYLIDRQRNDEALDLCESAWAVSSPLAVADLCLKSLSNPRASRAQSARVETQIRTAIAKHPGRIELTVALATVFGLRGDYDAAIAQYRQILAQHPRNAASLNNLSWLLALSGNNTAEALAFAERAVEVSGHAAGVLDTRAVAATAHGQRPAVERAIADLESVLSERPSSTVYFHLAQAHLRLNQRAEAAKAWKLAMSHGLSPDQLHPLERPGFEKLRQELLDRAS